MSTRCMACGRRDETIPGFRNHECSAPVGGSPVKVDQRITRDGLTGYVVEIDRSMARVYWPDALQSEWYPADDVADWADAS